MKTALIMGAGETWKSWKDDPSEQLFHFSKLAFLRAQFDPEPVYATMTASSRSNCHIKPARISA